MTTIQEYVIANYDTLPKSIFNDEECIIIKENHNDQGGYGHHSYSGIGIDREGHILLCYSSGCSCNGTCGMEHRNEVKVLEAGFDLSSIQPDEIDFSSISVSFSDY